MKRKIMGVMVAGLLMLAGVSGFTASSWAETNSTGPTRSTDVETNCAGSEDVNCDSIEEEQETDCLDDWGTDEEQELKCLDMQSQTCSGYINQDGDCVDESYETPGGTFEATYAGNKDTAYLRAGFNVLIAGSNLKLNASDSIDGLLFAAGNQVDSNTSSDYGFIAGNIVNASGYTERDLFVAGNVVTLLGDAEVGRDAYLAGNQVKVQADLMGDLSVAAGTVTLGEINVEGNVNLVADTVIFDKSMDIGGDLNIEADKIEFRDTVSVEQDVSYNDDANVNDLNMLDVSEQLTTYTRETTHDQNVWSLWCSKLLSIATLFLTTLVVMAVCKRTHSDIIKQGDMSKFGNNIAYGFCALIALPLLGLLGLCSFFLAPLGIMVIIAWIFMIYLSQGFTGVWLGNLIVTKVLKNKSSLVLDALIGVVILGILSLVPFVGVVTGFVSLVFGLGLIIQCLRAKKHSVIGDAGDISENGQGVDPQATKKHYYAIAEDGSNSDSNLNSDSDRNPNPDSASDSSSGSRGDLDRKKSMTKPNSKTTNQARTKEKRFRSDRRDSGESEKPKDKS